jgi:hypothetical protein
MLFRGMGSSRRKQITGAVSLQIPSSFCLYTIFFLSVFQKRKTIFLFRLFFSYNSTAIPERTILKIINQNFIGINLSAMLNVRQL